MQRGFTPVLIVILVAFILGGFLIYQKQTKLPAPQTTQSIVNSTTNLKTYTSQNTPFTFQYPSNATVNENQISDYYIVSISLPEVSINIDPINNHDSVCAGGVDIAKLQHKDYQTMIGNQLVKGSELVFSDGRSSTCKTLVLNDYNFVIQFNNSNSALRSQVNQILSTFKFTDQNQTTDTSNWKTWKDNTNTISLQYPSTWTIDPHDNNRLITTRPTSQKASGDFTPGFASLKINILSKITEESSGASGASKKEQIILGGAPATKLSGILSGVAGTVHSIEVDGSKNGKIYQLILSTQDTQLLPTFSVEFDQILSTFKFTQ